MQVQNGDVQSSATGSTRSALEGAIGRLEAWIEEADRARLWEREPLPAITARTAHFMMSEHPTQIEMAQAS